MKFSDLPQEIQNQLKQDRLDLYKQNVNTPYNITIYNREGTRYLTAYRKTLSSSFGPFGGGSQWLIRCGKVGFRSSRDPLGGIIYELCKGQCFNKSSNGTIIPSTLNTKKEVMELIKNIGYFE